MIQIGKTMRNKSLHTWSIICAK